ncbi:MAG: hypothetical protein O2917_03780, partial [Acidobacteria bacterium]|nr:hypothetical protein [Acidobacteriota bacterium]
EKVRAAGADTLAAIPGFDAETVAAVLAAAGPSPAPTPVDVAATDATPETETDEKVTAPPE